MKKIIYCHHGYFNEVFTYIKNGFSNNENTTDPLESLKLYQLFEDFRKFTVNISNVFHERQRTFMTLVET